MDNLAKVEDVKKTAPDLMSDMSDDTINELIGDASMQVLADHFPKVVHADGEDIPIRELATRYLTLHLATMDTKAGQGVVSEKVDVIERQYQNKTSKDWLNSSTWGQMYLRLYREYARGLSHYVIIQH